MAPNLSKLSATCCVALLALAAPACAQQPALPRPVLVTSSTETDPQALAWLTDDGRKSLAAALAQEKAGTIHAFVFAAVPSADAWAFRSTSKATDFLSVDDLARAALQTCQFFAKIPCYIISINGQDARDQYGGYPMQPNLLAGQRGRFDPARIPFVTSSDQVSAAAYANQTGPRAFVVTPSDYWLWRTGKTEFDAIASAYADCQKGAAGQTCVLYAVDDQVVFEPSHN